MDVSEKRNRELTISNLQKTITTPILTQYFTQTKQLEKIEKFSLTACKAKLLFNSQADANSFIHENCFLGKIQKHKFNIYYSYFDNPDQPNLREYELIGVKEENIRKAYEICSEYSPCQFKLEYEGKALKHKCALVLEANVEKSKKLMELKERLMGVEIYCKAMKVNTNEKGFKCSIELDNFTTADSISISEEQEKIISAELKKIVSKVTNDQISAMSFIPYLHQQIIAKVKAQFAFDTPQKTMQNYQLLRLSILDDPKVFSRLYFYEKEANSFQTLFTIGLEKPAEMNEKQFENALLESFRKINANIVQILVKSIHSDLWSAKIYLKDEQSGKDLVAAFSINRKHIFNFYRDKTRISINLFQKLQNINQTKRIQSNVESMLVHIKATKQKEMWSKPLIKPYDRPIGQNYPFGDRPQYRRRFDDAQR